MTTLENYLEKLNNKIVIKESPSPLLIVGIILFLQMLLSIYGTFLMSKRSSKYEKIMHDITGESRWKVRIMPISSPDAMATTFGPSTIFITSGLVKIMSERELMAIMLHEVKHLRTLDHLQQIIADNSALGILFSLAIKFSKTNKALSATFMVYGIISLFVLPHAVTITLGRWHEIKADQYPVKFGYGKDFISALKKIEQIDKKDLAGQKCGRICMLLRKVSNILDEHPDYKKRIEKVMEEEETQKAIASKSPKEILKLMVSLKRGNI